MRSHTLLLDQISLPLHTRHLYQMKRTTSRDTNQILRFQGIVIKPSLS